MDGGGDALPSPAGLPSLAHMWMKRMKRVEKKKERREMQVVPRRLGRRRPGLAPLWSGGFVLTGSPIYSRRKFEFGFVLLFSGSREEKKHWLSFHSSFLSFFF
jgi:hypothetical protein